MRNQSRLRRAEQRTNPRANPWHAAEVWTNEPDGSDRYTSPAVPDVVLTSDEVSQRPGHKIVIAYDHTTAPARTVAGRSIPCTLDLDRTLDPADLDEDADTETGEAELSRRRDRVPVVETAPESAISAIAETPPEFLSAAKDEAEAEPEPEPVDGVALWLEETRRKREHARMRALHRW